MASRPVSAGGYTEIVMGLSGFGQRRNDCPCGRGRISAVWGATSPRFLPSGRQNDGWFVTKTGLFHPYLWLDRHAGTQEVVGVLVVVGEVDADGNALHHLNVVSGCVLRREEAQDGTGCAT